MIPSKIGPGGRQATEEGLVTGFETGEKAVGNELRSREGELILLKLPSSSTESRGVIDGTGRGGDEIEEIRAEDRLDLLMVFALVNEGERVGSKDDIFN